MSAASTDRRPRVVVFGGGVLQTLDIPPDSPKHEELPVATRPGGDPERLNGLWRVEWQRRAGRATDRPRGMTWRIGEGTIAIFTGGANAAHPQWGGPRIPFRLDRSGAGLAAGAYLIVVQPEAADRTYRELRDDLAGACAAASGSPG